MASGLRAKNSALSASQAQAAADACLGETAGALLGDPYGQCENTPILRFGAIGLSASDEPRHRGDHRILTVGDAELPAVVIADGFSHLVLQQPGVHPRSLGPVVR